MKKTKTSPLSKPRTKKSSAAAPTSDPKRRRNIRFTPDPGTIALVDIDPTRVGSFKPTITCLVTEESFRGAGLVAISDKNFKAGARLRVAVGNAAPALAEVRWVSDLDSQVVRMGVMYVDLD